MNDHLVSDFDIPDVIVNESSVMGDGTTLTFECAFDPTIAPGQRGWMHVNTGTIGAPPEDQLLYVKILEWSCNATPPDRQINGQMIRKRYWSSGTARVLGKGEIVNNANQTKPDMISSVDQAGASLQTIAPAVSQFFFALRKQGRARSEAAMIVAAWVTLSSQDSAEQNQQRNRENKNG